MRKASERCFEMAMHFEGCKLKAYRDSARIWTLGIGTICYPDGKPVKEGHTCTMDQARQWFMWDIHEAESKLNRWLSPDNKKNLSQNKIDAIIDFVYNVGYGESLIKAINRNPEDVSIWGCFLLYDKVKATSDGKDNDNDGLIDEPGEMKKILGLLRRRNSEAHLYFKNELEFYEHLLTA